MPERFVHGFEMRIRYTMGRWSIWCDECFGEPKFFVGSVPSLSAAIDVCAGANIRIVPSR